MRPIVITLIIAAATQAIVGSTGQCEFGVPCDSVVLDGGVTMVCCHGEPPTESANGQRCVFGGELYVGIGSQQQEEWSSLGFWSEADPRVCYREDAGGIVVVDRTWDPRVEDFVEFTERRVSVAKGRLHCEYRTLLTPTEPPEGRQRELLARLSLPEDEMYAQYGTDLGAVLERTLYEIRNFGIQDPPHTLEKLRSLEGSWWDDGHLGETLSSVEVDLMDVADGLAGRCLRDGS